MVDNITVERIEPFCYHIDLTTGERIEIAEFDPEHIPSLLNPIIQEACKSIFGTCTFVERAVMEEAKRGLDTRFKKLMRSGPMGSLLKVLNPVCADTKDCVMYDHGKCTTRFIKKNVGGFPECWMGTPELSKRKLSPAEFRTATAIITSIVHAWREGQRVVIISQSFVI